ncbi:5284_t:CDS:2 [Diversispora eburnea]|uniref:5284_t:CDS:1 n=1 Tax=Diversispora eburnea TaxID=1213867 RepID=A0A9N8V1G8_9GLOM|nr:5284_t:CDS:2 [Diversispora eburnea]
MDFTELYKHSLNLCKFSPDLKYIATAFENVVIVRDTETFQNKLEFVKNFRFQCIEWSSDSTLLLAANFNSGKIIIRDVNNPSWKKIIKEGPAGLLNVKWNPDGRSVMCFSDFQLRITIWSLMTNKGYCIQDPKYHNKAERRECKDFIGIYKCDTDVWKLLNVFQVDTIDLDNLELSPNGQYIVVWDKCIWVILIYTLDGQCMGNFSIDDEGLGVKSIAWSPSSKLIAIGGYDQKKQVNMIPNLKDLLSNDIIEEPVELNSVQPDVKPNPKLGIGSCKFNSNGKLLAAYNDNFPNCLWIWDISHLNLLALIIQLTPIKHYHWNPVEVEQLAICCGNEYVYFWCGQDHGTEIIEVPADGNSMIIMDKTKFCVAFTTRNKENSMMSVTSVMSEMSIME